MELGTTEDHSSLFGTMYRSLVANATTYNNCGIGKNSGDADSLISRYSEIQYGNDASSAIIMRFCVGGAFTSSSAVSAALFSVAGFSGM